ncbi:MAG: HIT domain-containing protein [Planctomycetes bacterium]|nr:HIT domain-containing protein [Planctomycetota bacterium]
MNEERLWAPWRLGYVTGNEETAGPLPEPNGWLADADHNCFLCRAAASYNPDTLADKRLLVADRGDHSLVVLNRYPYNNGHLLISPRRHVGDLWQMNREEHVECVELLARLTRVYRECLNADGFNIGLNLGRAAGAGLPGHLHWHLVPRWAGDNNFMPVLAGTRVIPQSLEALWELLVGALGK